MAKGMDWRSYYHRTGGVQFPEKAVNRWNTNDHGVNNAEGAMRWPAVTYRMTGNESDAAQMAFALGTRHKPFNSTPMGVNSISSGSPHVRPMGVHRTCGA